MLEDVQAREHGFLESGSTERVYQAATRRTGDWVVEQLTRNPGGDFRAEAVELVQARDNDG